MTDIRRRLDQVVSKELSQHIIPVKTDKGILVGSVLIVSEGPVKHLYKNEVCVYNNISLNLVAIKLANALAKNQNSVQMDRLYRADTLWAKYCESKERTSSAKSTAVGLTYSV